MLRLKIMSWKKFIMTLRMQSHILMKPSPRGDVLEGAGFDVVERVEEAQCGGEEQHQGRDPGKGRLKVIQYSLMQFCAQLKSLGALEQKSSTVLPVYRAMRKKVTVSPRTSLAWLVAAGSSRTKLFWHQLFCTTL